MFYNGSTHHIGTFATKEGATDAYDKAAAIARRCEGAVQQEQQQQEQEREREEGRDKEAEEDAAAARTVDEAPTSGDVGQAPKRARVELAAEQEGAAGAGRGAAAAGQTAGRVPATSGSQGYYYINSGGFKGVSGTVRAAAAAAASSSSSSSLSSSSYNLWRAIIWYDGSEHHIGSFGTKEEAAAAYDREARVQIGENAVCNYTTQNEADAAAQVAAQAKDARTASGPKGHSGFYGVTASGSRWRARISYDGSMHDIGGFGTKEEAAAAYDKAARAQIGESTVCNYTTQNEADAAAQVAAQSAAQDAAQAKDRAEQAAAAHIERAERAAANGSRSNSGFRGVSASTHNRWTASIWSDGHSNYIGSFGTKEEAAAAFDKEARAQRGKSALCNYKSQNEADAAGQAAAQAKDRAEQLEATQKERAERAERAVELAAQTSAEWAAVM
jgi:hypothetical protein